MNGLKSPRQHQRRKQQLYRGGQGQPVPLRPSSPSFLLAVATILGFTGLMVNSIFAGSATHHGLMVFLSQGVRGIFMGVVIIGGAVLTAVTGCGVLLLPRKKLAASRLMAIAGLITLGLGLWLSFLGGQLLSLALAASACLIAAAIATLFERSLYMAKRKMRRDPQS